MNLKLWNGVVEPSTWSRVQDHCVRWYSNGIIREARTPADAEPMGHPLPLERETSSMSKPFDATLKDLANRHPSDYVTTFDVPPTLPVQALNVDLSTVTTSGDLVMGLGKPLKEIVHLDFQAGPDARKHLDVLAYNVLLHRHYGVPVHSTLVLLRRQAGHRNVTGQVGYAARPGRGRMDFGYEVVRLWEWPVEKLLTGPLGTLPLAVLGELPAGVKFTDGLRGVVERLLQRLEGEAEEGERKRLLTSAFVLSGLRVEQAQAVEVFKGVQAMRESTTYMMILEEGIEKGIEKGREQEARGSILSLGQKLHGKPTAAARKKLEAISDVARLRRIHDRLVEAKGWADLLDTP
jgi:hypothetical protein